MQLLEAAAALISKLKRIKGLEKKGLWSLSKTNTSDGGHLLIIASCCSGLMTRSWVVLMYTRFTWSTSPPSLNCARCIARSGPGRKSIEARVESWAQKPNKTNIRTFSWADDCRPGVNNLRLQILSKNDWFGIFLLQAIIEYTKPYSM